MFDVRRPSASDVSTSYVRYTFYVLYQSDVCLSYVRYTFYVLRSRRKIKRQTSAIRSTF